MACVHVFGVMVKGGLAGQFRAPGRGLPCKPWALKIQASEAIPPDRQSILLAVG